MAFSNHVRGVIPESPRLPPKIMLNLLEGLVALYEATFDVRWIDASLDLARIMIDQFWDHTDGGFFYTGKDHETLIARTKDPHDNATPSGNGVAVTALLRLGKLTGRQEFLGLAEATLQPFRGVMTSSPMGAAQMLLALDFHLGPVNEIVVVGARQDADVEKVLSAVQTRFRPHQVIAWLRSWLSPRRTS